jgi:uncharacterized membrane protein
VPDKALKPTTSRIRQYIVTGLLVVLPLWVTWLVMDFLFGLISSAGGPWVRTFARISAGVAPGFTQWLLNPLIQGMGAFLFVLVVLYFLGWFASRVLGRQALAYFNSIVEQIPFVQTIYGSTRKLLIALQQKPSHVQRVVLIEFPTPQMKTVGLVTRTFQDIDTGQELAAVYVPTTPNPTSGYLEIVPVKNIVSTDWSLDDAMNFIISGGTIGPVDINYTKSR